METWLPGFIETEKRRSTENEVLNVWIEGTLCGKFDGKSLFVSILEVDFKVKANKKVNQLSSAGYLTDM